MVVCRFTLALLALSRWRSASITLSGSRLGHPALRKRVLGYDAFVDVIGTLAFAWMEMGGGGGYSGDAGWPGWWRLWPAPS